MYVCWYVCYDDVTFYSLYIGKRGLWKMFSYTLTLKRDYIIFPPDSPDLCYGACNLITLLGFTCIAWLTRLLIAIKLFSSLKMQSLCFSQWFLTAANSRLIRNWPPILILSIFHLIKLSPLLLSWNGIEHQKSFPVSLIMSSMVGRNKAQLFSLLIFGMSLSFSLYLLFLNDPALDPEHAIWELVGGGEWGGCSGAQQMDPKSTMVYQPSCDCCQNAFLFSKVSRPLLLCFTLLGDCSSDFARNQISRKCSCLFWLVARNREFFYPSSPTSHPPACEPRGLAHHLLKHWFQKLTICFWLFGWGYNEVIDGSHFELSSCLLFSASLPELIACSPKCNCTARQ